MTDVGGTERTNRGNFAIFPNTLENVETLRLCLNEFPMNYIFFSSLIFIYFVFLGDFETRSKWSIFLSFHAFF